MTNPKLIFKGDEAERTMRYYKLVLRFGGGEKDISIDYFDNLDRMCEEIWRNGTNSFPCFESAEEVSKEEYLANHLPL